MQALLSIIAIFSATFRATRCIENFHVAFLGDFDDDDLTETIKTTINRVNQKSTDFQIVPIIQTIANITRHSPYSIQRQICQMINRSGDITAFIGPLNPQNVEMTTIMLSILGIPTLTPVRTDAFQHDLWGTYQAKLARSYSTAPFIALLEQYGWKKVTVVLSNDDYGFRKLYSLLEDLHSSPIRIVEQIVVPSVATSSDEEWEASRRKMIYRNYDRVNTFIMFVSSPLVTRTLELAAEVGLVGSDFYWLASESVVEETLYNETGLPWYLNGVVAVGGTMDQGNDVVEEGSSNKFPDTASWLLEDSVRFLHKTLRENLPELRAVGFKEYSEGCSSTTEFLVPYSFRYIMAEMLRNTTMEGDTGFIQLDEQGKRMERPSKSLIYNFVGNDPKLDVVGSSANGNLTLDKEVRFFTNFHRKQRHLRLGIVEDKPFVFYDYLRLGYDTCPDNITCYSGIAVSLLETLCRNLNITYSYHQPSNGTLGLLRDGNWDGLIGMLDADEIDISVNLFAQTSTRMSAVDFSRPLLDGGIFMVLNPAKEDPEHDEGFSLGQFFSSGYSNDGMFFLTPFSINLWCSIGVTCVCLWVLVWFYEKWSPFGYRGGTTQKLNCCNCSKCIYVPMSREQNLTVCPYDDRRAVKEELEAMDFGNSIWMMVSSILQVIPVPLAPRSWSSRLVATCWWLICLIMVAMYTANLTASMTRFSVSRAVKNVEDVMVSGSGLQFGTVNNSVAEQLIRSAEDFMLKDFSRRLSYVGMFEEGISRARGGHYAFLSEKIPLKYAATQEPCHLYVSDSKILDFSYSILYNKRLKDREEIDVGLLHLAEGNLVPRLWANMSRGTCPPSIQMDSTKPLDLGVMSGVFIMAVPLIFLAILLFLVEVITGTRISSYAVVNRLVGKIRRLFERKKSATSTLVMAGIMGGLGKFETPARVSTSDEIDKCYSR